MANRKGEARGHEKQKTACAWPVMVYPILLWVTYLENRNIIKAVEALVAKQSNGGEAVGCPAHGALGVASVRECLATKMNERMWKKNVTNGLVQALLQEQKKRIIEAEK